MPVQDKTMQLLAQGMSPKHSTRRDDNSAAYSESLALSRRTEEQYPKSVCDVFVAPFTGDTQKKKCVYQPVQDPAQGCGGAYVLGSFRFKPSPPGVPGPDHDGLEDTPEIGATLGHNPTHSVNIQKKFASKIIEEMSQPKRYHCVGTPLGRKPKELAIIRGLRIKSVDLGLHPVK